MPKDKNPGPVDLLPPVGNQAKRIEIESLIQRQRPVTPTLRVHRSHQERTFREAEVSFELEQRHGRIETETVPGAPDAQIGLE